ncbi:MAG: MBL fold metallo-hydrolase [Halioglobus sp.]|nr:MBL fold metallo-hydrolase [Halioglobus sp.]
MLDHGVPFRLTDRVQRIVAPNPGVMTGPGTNTYLLGDDEVAVLDPGPAIDAHVDAILDAAGDRIRWIVCTHTHPDHSPAWQAIAEQTGAQTLGGPVITDMFQDETFQPQRVLSHDDVLQTDEFTLRAVHTPGHVGNHFCYFLEQDGMMFAGDHIMNGSTVVIIPPSGDMKLYIESLRLLLDYPLDTIAPGHGDLIDDPAAAVEWLVNHRLQREAKVVAGLEQTGRTTLDELVKVVYDDVDTSLHKMARLSLSAHLIKLRAENRAEQHGEETWELS